MSYDIAFKVKIEGHDTYARVGDNYANITWNVRDIITKSTGLPWKNEESNGYCKDVIPYIEKGLEELRINGAAYKRYEAPNGWGTVEGTVRFFEQILKEWDSFVECYPELEEVTEFWVE